MGCCSFIDHAHNRNDPHLQTQRPTTPLTLKLPHNPVQTMKPQQNKAIRPQEILAQHSKTQEKSIQTIRDFLEGIKNQIGQNKPIYNQFLDVQEIYGILSLFNERFVDHQSATDILSMLIDFLSFCKNQSGCQPILPTTFTDNYPEQLAVRWQKIRDPNYLMNKSHLRILDFMVKKDPGQKKQYGMCYQDIRMDLSKDNSHKMAAIGNQMAREHNKSFCFLSNYLYGSCIILSDQGVSIQQIQKRYNQVLQSLCQKYRPAPEIQGRNDLLDVHPNYLRQDLKPKLLLDLRGKNNQEQILDDFIMQRADESKAQFNRFYNFMKSICEKNDGFRFQANPKIKEKSQKNALLRIKEKMLADIYQQKQLRQRTYGEKGVFLHLKTFVSREKQAFVANMKLMYQQLTQPLLFKVSDMLRAKCMFTTVENINRCCFDIKEALELPENQDLKLIEIDNRLRKKTSDLVVKVLFGTVITEMQLVINLSSAQYQFSHKLYELSRTKFFSPLTQLCLLNQGISRLYFLEAYAVIAANVSNKMHQYHETTTFMQVSKYFKSFIEGLPTSIDMSEKYPGTIDLLMMKNQIRKFQTLKESRLQQTGIQRKHYQVKLMEGKYFYEMSQYSKSLDRLNQALKQLQINIGKETTMNQQLQIMKALVLSARAKVYYNKCSYSLSKADYFSSLIIYEKIKGKNSIETAQTLNNIGIVYMSQGSNSTALNYYSRSLEILMRLQNKNTIQVALTLNNIGSVYKDQGNFHDALKFIFQCLTIQEKLKGRGHIDSAQTLLNIGSVYLNQGDFPKALEYYLQALQIQQNGKGKGNIRTAPTLLSIGQLYMEQGQYEKALNQFLQSLEIQQTVKGKGNIDTASALANIGSVYMNQSNFSKAFEYYWRSLQIQQSVKGKGSIDTASTLNKIGTVYLKQKNYQKAYEYYSQSLKIQQDIKGKGSIDTAQTYQNLGNYYNAKDQCSKALQCYQQSLKIAQNIKGRDSVSTAVSLSSIGKVYEKKRDYAKALQYYTQSLNIQKSKRDQINTETALTLTNIGKIYQQQGDPAKAQIFYSQSLEIELSLKGKGTTSTALTTTNNGTISSSQNSYVTTSIPLI